MHVLSSYDALTAFIAKQIGRAMRFHVIVTNRFISVDAYTLDDVIIDKAVVSMSTKDEFISPTSVVNCLLKHTVDFKVSFNLI